MLARDKSPQPSVPMMLGSQFLWFLRSKCMHGIIHACMDPENLWLSSQKQLFFVISFFEYFFFRSPTSEALIFVLSGLTRAPRPHGTPQGQPAARSEALALPEALAKDIRANEYDAAQARGPMPPAAIGTTPPTHHTYLTSTRAPRPHGAPQGQPAARSEASCPS